MSTRTHPAVVRYRTADGQCAETVVQFRPDATSTGYLSSQEVQQIRGVAQLPAGAVIDEIQVGRSYFQVPADDRRVRVPLPPMQTPTVRLCAVGAPQAGVAPPQAAGPSPQELALARQVCLFLAMDPSMRSQILAQLPPEQQAIIQQICQVLAPTSPTPLPAGQP